MKGTDKKHLFDQIKSYPVLRKHIQKKKIYPYNFLLFHKLDTKLDYNCFKSEIKLSIQDEQPYRQKNPTGKVPGQFFYS